MYKVVRKTGQHLTSAMVSGKFRVTYIPETWVKPDIGRIFVFNDRANAESFARVACPTEFDYELWLCEVQDFWDVPCVSPSLDDYSISRFWDDFYTRKNYLDEWPKNAWDGAFLVESIKLTRKVQEYPSFHSRLQRAIETRKSR